MSSMRPIGTRSSSRSTSLTLNCGFRPGIAHSVHPEIPLEWLTRVLDFLKRRGDEANDAIYRLRRARYADTRETIFDVQCSPLPLRVRG